jgi:hypothetical protein
MSGRLICIEAVTIGAVRIETGSESYGNNRNNNRTLGSQQALPNRGVGMLVLSSRLFVRVLPCECYRFDSFLSILDFIACVYKTPTPV